MSVAAAAGVTAGVWIVTYLLERRLAFAPPSIPTMMMFGMATVTLFALYAWLFAHAQRLAAASAPLAGSGTSASRRRERDRRLLLFAPVVIWLGLACTPPVLSVDVFSYLAHGYLVNAGANPYAVSARDVGHSEYGQALLTWGWLAVHEATPYGPLWTHLEAWAQRQSLSIYVQMLWLKIPVVLAGLASAALIGRITAMTAPALAVPAMVLFLWNPLVIAELAGSGHNDGLMLVLCLAGIAWIVRDRVGGGTAAVAAAALVKLNGLLVAPPLALLILRGHGTMRGQGITASRQRRIATAFLAGAAALLVGAWLYRPFWMGLATFQGLRLHALPNIAPATGGVLYYYLTRSHSEAASAQAVSLLLNGTLVAVVLTAAAWSTTMRRALAACAAIALAFLVFSNSYWPWYVVMPVALCALAVHCQAAVSATLLFSFFGRLVAPIDRLRLNGLMDWPSEAVVSTLLGVWVPAVLLIAFVLMRHAAAARGPWQPHGMVTGTTVK